jgi:SAM-dependent methyltransferase
VTDDDARASYEPERYWSERLRRDFSLRGVGHGQYSERYNRWIYRQKARVLAATLPPAPPGGRALDVGSGIGWVVEQLTAAGWDTDGCDISTEAVAALQLRFPRSSFVTHAFGAEALPHPDDSFDLVTMLDVTYHVVDDALWVGGLAELSRVLRPGGHVVLLDRFGATDDDVAAHVRFRSLSRYDQTCAALGLRRDLVLPAYRLLSRPPGVGALRALPDPLRGPLEFVLENVSRREPHMRCVRYLQT